MIAGIANSGESGMDGPGRGVSGSENGEPALERWEDRPHVAGAHSMVEEEAGELSVAGAGWPLEDLGAIRWKGLLLFALFHPAGHV